MLYHILLLAVVAALTTGCGSRPIDMRPAELRDDGRPNFFRAVCPGQFGTTSEVVLELFGNLREDRRLRYYSGSNTKVCYQWRRDLPGHYVVMTTTSSASGTNCAWPNCRSAVTSSHHNADWYTVHDDALYQKKRREWIQKYGLDPER